MACSRLRDVFTDARLALLGSFFIMMANGCILLQNSIEDFIKSYFYHTFWASGNDIDDLQNIKNIEFALEAEIGEKIGFIIGAIMFNYWQVNVKT